MFLGIEKFAEKFDGLRRRNIELAGEMRGGGQVLAQGIELGRLLGGGRAVANNERLAASTLEYAVVFEQTVGFAHRHRIEGQFCGEGAGRRQLCTGSEQARRDLEFYLVHDLPVGRHAVVVIDGEEGRHGQNVRRGWCIMTLIHASSADLLRLNFCGRRHSLAQGEGLLRNVYEN